VHLLDIRRAVCDAVLTVLCPRNRLQVNRGNEATSRDLRCAFRRNSHVDDFRPHTLLNGDKLHSPQRHIRITLHALHTVLVTLRLDLITNHELHTRRVDHQSHLSLQSKLSTNVPRHRDTLMTPQHAE